MINNVVFEDKDIIIINKPFGVLSQSDGKNKDEDLYTLVKSYLLKKGEKGNIGIINRLDRVVSGLIIFGKNNITNKILSENIKNHNFEKRYLAIVCGSAKEEDNLTDWIMKNQRLNISKIVNKNSYGGKEAKLSYKKVKEIETEEGILSLIDIKLYTGRHHQIRVQMANASLPLFGDTKYNKDFKNKRCEGSIGLFSYKIGFKHPKNNKYMEFEVYPKSEKMFCKFF